MQLNREGQRYVACFNRYSSKQSDICTSAFIYHVYLHRKDFPELFAMWDLADSQKEIDELMLAMVGLLLDA